MFFFFFVKLCSGSSQFGQNVHHFTSFIAIM